MNAETSAPARSWRNVLTECSSAPLEAMPAVFAAFTESGVGSRTIVQAFASCWRGARAPRLIDTLGTEWVVELLRRQGYWEMPETRARFGRLPCDWVLSAGSRWFPFEDLRPATSPATLPPLFRGAPAERVSTGLSWTPSRAVAAAFAARSEGGRLYCCRSVPAGALLLGLQELTDTDPGLVGRPCPAVAEYLLDSILLDIREVRL